MNDVPSLSTLSVYNEWDALAEIVVGDGQSVYFPGPHPIEDEAQHSLLRRMGRQALYAMLKGRKVPALIARHYQREQQALKEVLEDRGVKVHRSCPITPRADEAAGLGQMFARDPIMTVGKTMVVGKLQIDMRHKEIRGLEPLLEVLETHGVSVARLDEPGAYLEGGDVMLDWPNIYVGVGKYGSNEAGARWLQKIVGDDARVIQIPLAVPGILHLDCCMTLIGPGIGIIQRGTLPSPLPSPLNEYDFIEIDEQTRREMGGNILVLDPKTVVVQRRHEKLSSALRQRGFDVIPISFTGHANLDGAFRCATAPLRRLAAAV